MNIYLRHITLVLALIGAFISITRAQDVQFSQFYAAPNYLNPAFAGNTPGTRIASIYRTQWVAFTGNYRSYNVSVDHNFIDRNSGLGLNITKDASGTVDLNFTQVDLTYAYTIIINRSISAKLGLGLGYASRSADQSKFIFSSQINQTPSTPPAVNFDFQSSRYIDLSTGGILYGPNWWAGISLKHLNRPQQNIISNPGAINYVPMLTSFHSGYTIALKKSIKKKTLFSTTPVLHYKASQNWDQLDLGMYFNRRLITFGTWYRGLPLLKTNPDKSLNEINNSKPINQDALVLLFGLDIEGFRFAYSYDITISKLAGSSAGSHEISMIWEIASRKQKLSYKRHSVPCAKF